MSNHQKYIKFIWEMADLLKQYYLSRRYGEILLPMTLLRRFDCVLDNHSPFTFQKLVVSPDTLVEDMVTYIQGFPGNIQRIFESFHFKEHIQEMEKYHILYPVTSRFCQLDLSPDKVSNSEMLYIFEDIVRLFYQRDSEYAGDYYTPRDIIKLMVNLLFSRDKDRLSNPGRTLKIFDPTCGSGGMLINAQNYMNEHHPETHLQLYGQDINPEAFAIAASTMLIKEAEHDATGENIRYGNSLIHDQFRNQTFDYFIANPPLGMSWKGQQKEIVQEYEEQGYGGRFGAGIPRVSDSSLLFLQHMISKFKKVDTENKKYGSRLAVIFNNSPQLTGEAGSGESNIRRWIIENDWLEAIISLPEDMFYNTGMGTYIWIITNWKQEIQKGKIQLIDARKCYIPMSKSIGNRKRRFGKKIANEPDHIRQITELYENFKTNDDSRFFRSKEFGYTRITIERPLRLRYQMTFEDKARFLNARPHLLDDIESIDKELGRESFLNWNNVDKKIRNILRKNNSHWKVSEFNLFRDVFTHKDPTAEKVMKGEKYEPDTDSRDFIKVPLEEDIDQFFNTEILSHVPDAWVDRSKDRVGYEINFNKYFPESMKQRSVKEIDEELNKIEEEMISLIKNQ